MCFFKTVIKLESCLAITVIEWAALLTVASVCAIMHWFAEIFRTPERAFNSLVYIKDTKVHASKG